jgi:hypothetical protein
MNINIQNSHRATIQTKFIPCTNFRPSRVKAWCQRGSLFMSWEDALNSAENHERAARLLIERFIKEDGGEEKCGWAGDWIMGATVDTTGYVFVVAP